MPMDSDLDMALAELRASKFSMNTHWELAHTIAQRHEGSPKFDAVHALCHRIEGDISNAEYWDRRAGTNFGQDGLRLELERVVNFCQS